MSVLLLLSFPLAALSVTPTTLISSHTSVSDLALPTSHYTGQALLTGTCATPVYSTLHFAGAENRDILEVPLIGCSDERLGCCPSLWGPKSTSKTWTGFRHTSTGTGTGSIQEASSTVTGIVSKLNASPLSVCPSDFVNLSPVCCPIGYSLYPTALWGRVTPCYSMLSTPISVPSGVLASISSAIEATLTSIETTATVTVTKTASSAANPTKTANVDVVVNQVFAIGLPCAVAGDFAYHSPHVLSTAAKAGIAAAVVVAVLMIALAGMWWHWCMRMRPSGSAHNQIAMDVYRGGRGKDDNDDMVELVGRRARHASGVSISTTGGALISPPLERPEYVQGYVHGVHAAAQFQALQRDRQQQQEEALLPAYQELELEYYAGERDREAEDQSGEVVEVRRVEAGGHELVEAQGRELIEMDGRPEI